LTTDPTKPFSIPSVLAARIGLDRNGFHLMRYLREEGVELINTPNADFTGIATSRRRGGEPSYDFTPSLYRRRTAFNSTLLKEIGEAPAIAVNSFSFADPKQADALGEAPSRAPGFKILDPNPRPRLIADLDAFRQGFERTIRTATLVKLSDEDAPGGVDDELPHRIEVKLAGALIRIFEYAGAYQLDLDGAVRERLAYKEAA
jgi:fructokinase